MELFLSYRDESLRDLKVQILNIATNQSWSPSAKAFVANDAPDVLIPLSRPEKSVPLRPFATGFVPDLPEPSATGAFMAFVVDSQRMEVVGDPVPISPDRRDPPLSRLAIAVTFNGKQLA